MPHKKVRYVTDQIVNARERHFAQPPRRSDTSINPRPAVVTFLLTEDDADLNIQMKG
jgi:hypothetical protein